MNINDKVANEFVNERNSLEFAKAQATIAMRFCKDTFELAQSYGIPPNVAVFGSAHVLAEDLFKFVFRGDCTLEDILSIFESSQPDEWPGGTRPIKARVIGADERR